MIETALIAAGVLVLACLLLMAHPRTRAALRDGARLLRALAGDKRIPRPIRWLLRAADWQVARWRLATS
ncbi:MAG: hypothetical protein ACR2IP_08225 [Solirubrobacteraceae bacterium]